MIIKSIKRYWNAFLSFFDQHKSLNPAHVAVIANDVVKEAETNQPKALKKDLLDNLDAYFKYIKQMRKLDPKSYEFYRKLGGQLIVGEDAQQTLHQWASLPTRWLYTRPSFGCVMVEEDPASYRESSYMRFAYFRKHTNYVENVQPVPVDGDIYIVSTVHSFKLKNDKEERDALIQFPVLITKDNQCKILLMKQNDRLVINSKRPGGHKGTYTVHRSKWALPEWALIEAKKKKKTPEEIMLSSFYFAAQLFEIAQHQMIDVRATKGNICARFNIKGDVTAGLFRDREIVGNRKKKIFHSVKPHIRSNGAVIKMHFRGERKFTWNGYSIAITVPGKDYAAFMPEMTFSAVDYKENEIVHDDMVDMQEVSNKLVNYTTKAVA